MKVKIKTWKTVSYWSWDGEDDGLCSICQNYFDGCCPLCKIPGDDCPLVWGKCRHAFHLHCIETWFKNSANGENCPLDRTRWVTATADD
ncbi:RING/U-box [Backusella circina FSU 941]|nr:RING/U-box [Backusella circina FSU 941]